MRRAADAFDLISSTVLGAASGLTALVVMVAWIIGGDDALGLDGAWAHLIAVAAFYAYMEAAFARAQRIDDKYRTRP